MRAVTEFEKRLKALRVLETSFPVYSPDGRVHERKTHYLLTYTPRSLLMAEEEYQLRLSQIQDLFALANDVLRIAKKKVQTDKSKPKKGRAKK